MSIHHQHLALAYACQYRRARASCRITASRAADDASGELEVIDVEPIVTRATHFSGGGLGSAASIAFRRNFIVLYAAYSIWRRAAHAF